MKKTVIASIIAGGVLVSGITFTGMGGIQNTKDSLDSLRDKLTQAVDDNEFLKTQFGNLKDLYSDTLASLSALTAEKEALEAQIAELQSQLEGTDESHEDAKTELQAEIDRLEGELEKANEAIAELEAYAQQVDDSVTYEPIDRSQYTVNAEEAPQEEEAPAERTIFITDEAKALNHEKASEMAKLSHVEAIEDEFINAYGVDTSFRILGVTVANVGGTEMFAYVIEPDSITIGVKNSPRTRNLMNAMNVSYFTMVNQQGAVVVKDKYLRF